MAKANFLTDESGNKMYPVSHADATYTSDGAILGTVVSNMDNEITSIKSDLSNVGGSKVNLTLGTEYASQSATLVIGSKTYTTTTDTSGNGAFKVLEVGSATVTCNGDSTSIDIPYYGVYAIDGFTVDGATVTPTDDIQTWLKCAKISKSYTTISEVLADSTTLLALISSENASKYMARSTTWASDVCANSDAMTDIGNNDTCADLLLADETWLEAICDSDYFESVLNVKVPTMTSNTTPSGEVSASSQWKTTYPYWYAFSNCTTTDGWIPNGTSGWVQYKFTEPMVARKFRERNYNSSGGVYTNRPSTVSIQGSNDGSTWTTIASGISILGTTGYEIYQNLNNSNAYLYYRVNTVATGSEYPWLGGLNFYGRY